MTRVRGYNERDANGSAGFLVSQELRSPSFSLIKEWLPDGITDQAQLLVFWDYGSVRDAQFTPGAPPSIKLSSLGVGARYTRAVSGFSDRLWLSAAQASRQFKSEQLAAGRTDRQLLNCLADL